MSEFRKLMHVTDGDDNVSCEMFQAKEISDQYSKGTWSFYGNMQSVIELDCCTIRKKLSYEAKAKNEHGMEQKFCLSYPS